jgi:hypothetical protein
MEVLLFLGVIKGNMYVNGQLKQEDHFRRIMVILSLVFVHTLFILLCTGLCRTI